MPGLTITTDVGPASATAQPEATPPRRASASSRPPSPSPPSVSPITPTHESPEVLGSRSAYTAPTTTQNTIPDFATGRPIFTHTTQTVQVGMAPPPAQPIDFESNPDVLALKSAISILQLQRARATADVQSLSRARDAALANPEAFTADLASGRVRMEGDPLLSGTRGSSGGEPMDEDSSSSSSESDDDESTRQEVTPESESKTDNDNRTTPTNRAEAATAAAAAAAGRTSHRQRKQKHTGTPTTSAAPPWQKLPKPQTVVRCPPVNWAQYGVVGESLDKLHAEQVAAPAPGAPMVLGQGGTYEFKAGGADQGGGGGEPSRRLVGVAAPYSPMRDKLEKKGKGGKR